MNRIPFIFIFTGFLMAQIARGQTPLNQYNALTPDEKEAGIFTPEVMWKMGRLGQTVLSPDGQTIAFTLTYYNLSENKGRTNIYTMPSEGGSPVLLTDCDGNDTSPTWSADGEKIYFLSARENTNQLWSVNRDRTDMKRLSDIEGGIDGFGIAPSGDKLWFTRRVKTSTTKADLHPDMDHSPAMIYDDLMERHWDHWSDGTSSHLFIAGFDGEKISNPTDVVEGEPWDVPLSPYFDTDEIAWSPNGKTLAYTCKKMTGKNYALSTDSDIYLYDTETGLTTNITEGMPGYEKYPRFSPDGTMVAFSSQSRPGNEADKTRLMVKNLATGAIAYLTENFDYNADNVSWENNSSLLFIAPIEATRQICRVTLDSNVTVLTSGDHDFTDFDRNGSLLIATLTRHDLAPELHTVNRQTGAFRQLTEINRETYEHIPMGRTEKRWVETTDGKQMLVWVIFPPDFDPAKKYPTLLYCQGGPQSVVSQFWSYRWNFQLMAAQGYIVVAPNRRGLPSFGQEWLDQISGDYSGQNIRDYLSAIDDVSREPWADENRLGCVGASYGGYSSYYLAGHHEGRFKAFISHCGMFNFESFYLTTEELWFPNNDIGGPYWSDNPVAQRSFAHSPHRFVEEWDTPILIFVGLKDFRIPYTESIQAFHAARLRGLPSRLVAFPDEGHQVFKPQNSVVWNREFFNWLDRYVKDAR